MHFMMLMRLAHLLLLPQVAVDFVSPESMGEALASREALRAADQALPQPLGTGPEQREFQVRRGVTPRLRTRECRQGVCG
jgi:hypothetical protein